MTWDPFGSRSGSWWASLFFKLMEPVRQVFDHPQGYFGVSYFLPLIQMEQCHDLFKIHSCHFHSSALVSRSFCGYCECLHWLNLDSLSKLRLKQAPQCWCTDLVEIWPQWSGAYEFVTNLWRSLQQLNSEESTFSCVGVIRSSNVGEGSLSQYLQPSSCLDRAMGWQSKKGYERSLAFQFRRSLGNSSATCLLNQLSTLRPVKLAAAIE